jgi:2,5-diketo-D-gluconate reductase B
MSIFTTLNALKSVWKLINKEQDMHIPVLGLGTFRLKDEVALNSVKMALEVGYRHIDTAQIYENESEVGAAIKESNIKREEIFITTKIWTANLSAAKLIPSLKESLEKLKTDYVDLTLIHWPSPNHEIPLEESLNALLEAKKLGLTKEIGVSNFPIDELKKAIAIVGSEEIFTNQFEVHPYLQNKKLIDFCNAQDILVTAYMPLAYGKVVKDATLISIGEKYGISAADVALAWLHHQELIIIPSSTKKQNMENNLNFPEIKFTKKELSQIAALNDGSRIANPEFSPIWDN